jgi:hypothetical protein
MVVDAHLLLLRNFHAFGGVSSGPPPAHPLRPPRSSAPSVVTVTLRPGGAITPSAPFSASAAPLRTPIAVGPADVSRARQRHRRHVRLRGTAAAPSPRGATDRTLAAGLQPTVRGRRALSGRRTQLLRSHDLPIDTYDTVQLAAEADALCDRRGRPSSLDAEAGGGTLGGQAPQGRRLFAVALLTTYQRIVEKAPCQKRDRHSTGRHCGSG